MRLRPSDLLLCSLCWLILPGCSTEWSNECVGRDCPQTPLSGPEANDDDDVFYPYLDSLEVDGWPCNPRGDFCEGKLVGFDVQLSLETFSGDSNVPDQVISKLREDLTVIEVLLEEPVFEFLHRVPFWIGVEEIGNATGYYTNGWVGLPRPERYLAHSELSPAIILHELAHAWHDLGLGFDDEDVLAAYENAMLLELYEVEGSTPHYATGNEREYFATLTESWFWLDDEYPTNRQEFLEHDPVGAEMVARSWRW